MSQTVKIDINNNIAIITLSRPAALNAFNSKMAVDLLRAFESVQKNANVRAILLSGEGNTFCVGGDITEFADKMDRMPANIPDTMEVLNALILLMRQLNKPILASVQGSVAGVGMSFLMACDLAIAAESTKFTLAYANIGLSPDGGASYMLPRVVGSRKAMQMALLPDVFSAAQALDLGILNWVAPDADLDSMTMKLMYRLANGPSVTYGRAKALINQSWHSSLDDQLTAEMHAFTECTITKDFRRGVEGFLNKTKAVFEGD
jgi:2-(1,2-epoxy-1,2-dihydrophenyl)acetyl-CoA isomerase